MSVGFRPTAADNEIIQAHKRPDESTSDVLRRALRALDRERWQAEAQTDMERIAASREDLSDEPDDWGFDEDGQPVDLRDGQPPRADEHEKLDRSPIKLKFHENGMVDVVPVLAGEMGTDEGLALFKRQYDLCLEQFMKPLLAGRLTTAQTDANELHEISLQPKTLPSMPHISAPLPIPSSWSAEALRPSRERDRATPWKLAHLRAAARRAKSR